MQNARKLLRQPITTIIEQHVEEAAFCWLRREDSLWSPNFTLGQFYRIDQRLDAHLEGLRIATDSAWPYAQKRMEKWKTADETFAASYIAINAGQEVKLQELANFLRANNDVHAGISAALQLTLQLNEKEKTLAAIKFFWQQHDSLKSAVIDTALLIPEININTLLSTAINSTDITLRTKALKSIGNFQLKEYIPFLIDALNSQESLCKLAASTSLAILGEPEYQANTIQLIPLLNRSDRLKHLLVWASTSSESDFNNGLHYIKTNLTLSDFIWANAFRGDNNSLIRLSALLEHKIASPLAAYAIHHITGVDLDSLGEIEQPKLSSGMDEEEKNVPLPIKQLLRETEGLSSIPPAALKNWLAVHWNSFPNHERFLHGTSMDTDSLQLDESCAMPQHWQRAFIAMQAGDPLAWTSFPQPLFAVQQKDLNDGQQ